MVAEAELPRTLRAEAAAADAAPVTPPIGAVRAACTTWRSGLAGYPVAGCACEYPTAYSSLSPCREAVRLAREQAA